MAMSGNVQATLRAQVWIEAYHRERERGAVDPLAVARAFKAMKRELNEAPPAPARTH